MITKAGKAALLGAYTYAGSRKALFEFKTVDNTTKYISNNLGSSIYPYTLTTTLRLSNTNTGIYVGSGTTAPTENDNALETMITSGLTGVISQAQSFNEEIQKSSLEIDIALTNTGSAAVTVGEIGLAQYLNASSTKGDTTSGVSSAIFLIDRTTLETPVTIEPSGTKTIKYTLVTDMS